MSPQELEEARDAVAYGCVKYADLSQTRTQDYVFSFDKVYFVCIIFHGSLFAFFSYCCSWIEKGNQFRQKFDFTVRIRSENIQISSWYSLFIIYIKSNFFDLMDLVFLILPISEVSHFMGKEIFA